VKRLGFFCMLFLGLFASQIMAQETTQTSRYFWETARLYVRVPAGWASPVPLEQNDTPILLVKPALIGAESAGGLTIQFKLMPAPETPDLNALLQAEFEGLGLQLSVTQAIPWLNGEAVESFGIDDAQTLYGRGRAVVRPDGQILLVMAYGSLAEIQTLQSIFLDVVFGTTDTDFDPGRRPYGISWELNSTGADGEQAFIQPQALVVEGQTVYIADLLNGILAFDALTGAFLWQQRVAPDAQITALVVDANGVVYAGDTGTCACIYRVTQISSEIAADGFGSESPRSLAVRADGAVLATDVRSDGSVRVRVIGADGEQESLLFETPLVAQPTLLTSPDDMIYAITDANELLRQEGAGFSLVMLLEIPVVINKANQLVMNGQGLVTVASVSEGVYTFDSLGQSSLSPLALTPDAELNGIAFGSNGTIFTLQTTPEQTHLTAWRNDTVTGGVGRELLTPGRSVVGHFDSGSQEIWLLAGQAGDVIDLTAAPINADESFLMTLRLIDAKGEILGEQTITAIPVPPLSIPLEEADLYFLVAQRESDTNAGYELGYRAPLLLTAVDQAVSSTLTQAMPIQRWIIDAQAGQTITAYVTPTSGTLDPSLRLVNPRGTEVDINEDVDPALGLDAALTEIRLSNNGGYILEVTATTGAGSYQLTIDMED